MGALREGRDEDEERGGRSVITLTGGWGNAVRCSRIR